MSEDAQKQFQDWMNSQSGYIGKEKKARWWADYEKNQKSQKNMGEIFSNDPQKTMDITGSASEVAGRVEGLQRAKMLTGQNPYQIGQDFQDAYGMIKKRSTGSDTGSELLRANKAGAVATARQQMEQQGVKGGAALGAVSSVERSKAYDVNNQLMDAQRKAENDYMSAVKGNANFTLASEMGFGSLGAANDMKDPAAPSNGFGTVICTELYRQGYYTKEIYLADQIYGLGMMEFKPHIYFGYRAWADYVVKGMRRSKLFTKFIAFFAVPWAKNMAGHSNLFGKIIAKVGEPICGLIGKLIMTGDKNEVQEA